MPYTFILEIIWSNIYLAVYKHRGNRYYIGLLYMETFYLIVLSIATIILILALTIIGVMLRNQYKKAVFPPKSSTCPDGWTYVDPSGCKLPDITTISNYKNTGILPDNTTLYHPENDSVYKNFFTKVGTSDYYLDPSNNKWASITGTTAICAQKNWATQYNILWDGVSNYNQC